MSKVDKDVLFKAIEIQLAAFKQRDKPLRVSDLLGCIAATTESLEHYIKTGDMIIE